MSDVKRIRQMTLIAILEQYDRWMKQEEVLKEMGKFYPPVKQGIDAHNSTARVKLTKDIQEINESKEFNRIIVHGERGIKVATEQEAVNYLHNQYKEAFGKLKRIHSMEKKMESDGQYDMFDIPNYIQTFITDEVSNI